MGSGQISRQQAGGLLNNACLFGIVEGNIIFKDVTNG
jgi:hypothetical protein